MHRLHQTWPDCKPELVKNFHFGRFQAFTMESHQSYDFGANTDSHAPGNSPMSFLQAGTPRLEDTVPGRFVRVRQRRARDARKSRIMLSNRPVHHAVADSLGFHNSFAVFAG